MKAYTDIEQSNMLAEILPLESADMSYRPYREIGGIPDYQATLRPYKFASWAIPCWSLAALLDILPVSCDDGQHCLALINPNPNDKTEWLCAYEDCKGDLIMECYADNPVDACVDMIVELNKRNLI